MEHTIVNNSLKQNEIVIRKNQAIFETVQIQQICSMDVVLKLWKQNYNI